MTARHYHRRLPCCGRKPKVDTPGHTTSCKCGFTYRAVEDGIWIKWERVVAVPLRDIRAAMEAAT